MAKTPEDTARVQRMLERIKTMPKSLNLKENYQELADAAAEATSSPVEPGEITSTVSLSISFEMVK